jgi:hypothetical protein
MRWGLVTPLRQATAVGARPGSLVRLLGGRVCSLCRLAAALSTQPPPRGAPDETYVHRGQRRLVVTQSTITTNHDPPETRQDDRGARQRAARLHPAARVQRVPSFPRGDLLARACSSADTARQSATDGPDRGLGGSSPGWPARVGRVGHLIRRQNGQFWATEHAGVRPEDARGTRRGRARGRPKDGQFLTLGRVTPQPRRQRGIPADAPQP